jgi:hypothetical protein
MGLLLAFIGAQFMTLYVGLLHTDPIPLEMMEVAGLIRKTITKPNQ